MTVSCTFACLRLCRPPRGRTNSSLTLTNDSSFGDLFFIYYEGIYIISGVSLPKSRIPRECPETNRSREARGWWLSHLFSAPARHACVPLVGLSPQGTTGNSSAKIASGCRYVFFFCPLVQCDFHSSETKMGFLNANRD